EGVRQFDRKMKGYLSDEALVVATESRTSAPIRIPRDPHTLMHPDLPGLFPCGEGAGYAGGIISAAMDGQRVAHAASILFQQQISR
ncbi:MAG: FAD-binding protein, partial [Saprospiraceae bacterium]